MRDRRLGPAEVEARYGVPPAQMLDLRSLVGDSSDNIPGVKGIGEKGAAELLRAHGSLDALLANPDVIAGKRAREALRAGAEMARLSRELSRLRDDLPIAFDPVAMALPEPDRDALAALFRELELKRLLEQLGDTTPARVAVEAAPVAIARRRQPGRGRGAGRAARRRARALARARARAEAAAARRAARGRARDRRRRGRGRAAARRGGRRRARGAAAALHARRADLDRQRPEGRAARARPARDRARRAALRLDASRRTSPTRPSPSSGPRSSRAPISAAPSRPTRSASARARSAARSTRCPTRSSPSTSASWRRSSRCCCPRSRSPRAHRAARALPRARGAARRRARADGAGGRARRRGEARARSAARLERELDAATETRSTSSRARTFHIGSPKQLQTILFEKLAAAGAQEDQDRLLDRRGACSRSSRARTELPREILAHRRLAKLKSTYVDALPPLVDPETGRIHPRFHQTVRRDGAALVVEPEPAEHPDPQRGRRARSARRSSRAKARVLLSADYSQIELRILAHFSQRREPARGVPRRRGHPPRARPRRCSASRPRP